MQYAPKIHKVGLIINPMDGVDRNVTLLTLHNDHPSKGKYFLLRGDKLDEWQSKAIQEVEGWESELLENDWFPINNFDLDVIEVFGDADIETKRKIFTIGAFPSLEQLTSLDKDALSLVKSHFKKCDLIGQCRHLVQHLHNQQTSDMIHLACDLQEKHKQDIIGSVHIHRIGKDKTIDATNRLVQYISDLCNVLGLCKNEQPIFIEAKRLASYLEKPLTKITLWFEDDTTSTDKIISGYSGLVNIIETYWRKRVVSWELSEEEKHDLEVVAPIIGKLTYPNQHQNEVKKTSLCKGYYERAKGQFSAKLSGSENQINWAMKIREEKVQEWAMFRTMVLFDFILYRDGYKKNSFYKNLAECRAYQKELDKRYHFLYSSNANEIIANR